MSSTTDIIPKPKLTTAEQISHLLSKGVKFERISIEEARKYLSENNNYFKLRAYRKNYPKSKGQYINLDFEYLKDLSIIDMRLRYTFIHMALDIEHFAKVKLLRALEISSCDGYDIVKKYRARLKEEDERKNSKRSVHLENELARNNNNPYCGGIIQSYSNNYPMWAFIEIIPLGSFVDFYGFCANDLSDVDKSLRDDYYLLKTINELRNAAAHSNCIINSMGAKDSRAQANYCVIRGIDSISKSRRDRQLKNERMRQMVTMLYLHKEIVTSNGVHNRAKKDLNDAVERMYKNIEFYRDNATVLSFFSFFKDSVDIFFS